MDFMSWQLDYLYLLQCCRIPILDNIFSHITMFGEIIIPLAFTCIIYWCVNKKTGMYLLWCYIVSYMINVALKVTACINRPWILDSRIKPLACAIPMATGYSFPSGHTACATAIWGGFGVTNWKNKLIRYVCFTLVLLVMFSRNYVGVHTPQDVVVSFIVGLIVIFTLKKIKNVPLVVMTIGCIALGYYVCTKAYPFCPLYDPTPIKGETIGRIGFFLSIAYGSFVERNYIKFDVKGTILSRIIRAIIGLATLYGLFILSTYAKGSTMYFFANALIGFFITAIYPWFIKLTHRYI